MSMLDELSHGQKQPHINPDDASVWLGYTSMIKSERRVARNTRCSMELQRKNRQTGESLPRVGRYQGQSVRSAAIRLKYQANEAEHWTCSREPCWRLPADSDRFLVTRSVFVIAFQVIYLVWLRLSEGCSPLSLQSSRRATRSINHPDMPRSRS